MNRHFYHSINVQAICLADGRFSDVLARFPGSVHNSRIWKLSQVGIYVGNNFLAGEHILGDSGYMLKPYLLTPYRQPATNAQENYNCSHKKTRVLIEQTFGRWKLKIPLSSRRVPDGSRKSLHYHYGMCSSSQYGYFLWKQPMLEDSTIDHHTGIMDEVFAFEETGHLAAKHYWDQFVIHNFS